MTRALLSQAGHNDCYPKPKAPPCLSLPQCEDHLSHHHYLAPFKRCARQELQHVPDLHVIVPQVHSVDPGPDTILWPHCHAMRITSCTMMICAFPSKSSCSTCVSTSLSALSRAPICHLVLLCRSTGLPQSTPLCVNSRKQPSALAVRQTAFCWFALVSACLPSYGWAGLLFLSNRSTMSRLPSLTPSGEMPQQSPWPQAAMTSYSPKQHC